MNTNTVAGMVAEARMNIEELTPEGLAEEMAHRGPLLIDIREPEERVRTGSIPGAVSAVRGMIEFYADPASPYYRSEFDPAQRVVLFCASGGRSALAGRSLRQLGYVDVAHLAGGVNAWNAAGYQLEAV